MVYAKGCLRRVPARPRGLRGRARTLALLGLDRVDVFILHRDDPSLPVDAFADALFEQVDAGRIGAFGVSNWTVPRLRELHDHLERDGRTASSR